MSSNATDRSSKVKRFIVGGLIIVITAIIAVALFVMSNQKAPSQASDEWELTYDKVSSAQVFVNEQLSPDSNLYRGSSGRFLVQVKYPDMEVIYVIYPELGEVDWADGFSFRESGEKMQLIKSPPHIKGINKALAGTTPDLIVKGNYLEFKSGKDKRVSATW
jgi:hypothetical protein